mgnify:CR=1 FL=1
MKINLIDFYQYKDNTFSIKLNFNEKEIEFFLNNKNISKYKKLLRARTFTEFIDKYNSSYKSTMTVNSKKKVISKDKFDKALKTFKVEYNFIGNYLVSVLYQNINYIIDLYSDSIEVCCILESFENGSEQNLTEEIDTNEEDSGNDLINKIKNINGNLPTDFESLIQFSMNNANVMKPILQIINSKTDNLLGSLIDSTGINYNLKNKISFDTETDKISRCLKIIEELNNNDINNLSSNEQKKFNYIISQIWEEIKNILSILNNLKNDNDFQSVIDEYKASLSKISFKNEIDSVVISKLLKDTTNSIYDKIINSFIDSIESKYLELNILIQDNNNETNDSKLKEIINNKLDIILKYNFNLYLKYFKNFYNVEDVFNIFSDFNKDIKFNNIIASLSKNKISVLILKIEDLKEKIVSNSVSFDNIQLEVNLNFEEDTLESNRYNRILDKIKVDSSQIIDYYYLNFNHVYSLVSNGKEEFIDKINVLYNIKLLSNKKKKLSEILMKFHEDISFRLSIIKKVLEKRDI